ncbi:MAG: hypothetical protein QOH47_2413 [Sphingomonadales bacterium]|jgi:hypothetical protein|nr:hypothetical protein [Sphingomonadales bacterium]
MAEVHADAVPLPPASIDFNALNDALAAGHAADKARNAAIVEGTLALSADEAQARAAESAAALPSLVGLNKDALVAASAAENVQWAQDSDGNAVPFAEASNARMREAIEAMRDGTPIASPDAPAE